MTPSIFSTLCISAVFAASAAAAVTPRDKDIVDTCLMMSIDAMVNDTVCRDLMRRWNITTADMVMIKACKAMRSEQLKKDVDCLDVRKKHPDLVAAALRP
jgi:hemoglobin-like flavoprotein